MGLKVAIGLPGAEGEGPKKLDHFIFLTKDATGKWKENPAVTKVMEDTYSKPVRRFGIILMSDDIETVLASELAWWSKTECKCHGDGLTAERSVAALPDDMKGKYKDGPRFVPWKPCGQLCPQFHGPCKPSGSLQFVLADLPKLGSLCAFFTTSKRTIRQTFSTLHQVSRLTHGRMTGIRMEMVMKPGPTRYQTSDGSTRKGTAYFVNLEFRDTDYKKLLTNLSEQSFQFEKSIANEERRVKLIGAGGSMVMPQTTATMTETDKAAIMGPEFYHPDSSIDDADDDDVESQRPNSDPPPDDDVHEVSQENVPPPESEKTKTSAVDKSDKALDAVCEQLVLSAGKRNHVLAKFGGDITAAADFLTKFAEMTKKLGASREQADEWLKKGVMGDPTEMFDYLEKEMKKKAKEAKASKAKTAPAEPATQSAADEAKQNSSWTGGW